MIARDPQQRGLYKARLKVERDAQAAWNDAVRDETYAKPRFQTPQLLSSPVPPYLSSDP